MYHREKYSVNTGRSIVLTHTRSARSNGPLINHGRSNEANGSHTVIENWEKMNRTLTLLVSPASQHKDRGSSRRIFVGDHTRRPFVRSFNVHKLQDSLSTRVFRERPNTPAASLHLSEEIETYNGVLLLPLSLETCYSNRDRPQLHTIPIEGYVYGYYDDRGKRREFPISAS